LRLLTWLPPVLGAATWLAASSCTSVPRENFARPVVGAGGNQGTPSGGGGSSADAGASNLGGAELGGAGSGGATSSGSGGEGSGAAGSGGTPSWSIDDDCERPSGDTPAFTREALRGAASACVQYHYCRFEAVSQALVEHTDALVLEPSSETQTIAREVFLEALRRWSVLELMQFGPVASASAAAGKDSYQGQGLRELIYSWPQVSRCRVDEQVASQKYQTLGMSTVLISARGLPAIETALFYEGSDTECGTNTTTSDLWLGLDAGALAQRRRAYAQATSADVLLQAQGLVDRWSPSGGNFQQTFVSASGYPDEQEAMNVLGWALVYLEREVKDWKLGIPAGYTVGAPVSGPESFFAGEQSSLLSANLLGFREIFEGCGPGHSGVGFDDWLAEAGHTDLAADILAASSAAEPVLAQLPKFAAASQPQIEAAYVAIKAITDLLKADLFGAQSPLNLKLPASVEGDTD
jgi:predicted lipoprotein